MAKLAPNIFHLFSELPASQRFEAVAECGFDAVEWHDPYQLTIAELRALKNNTGVRVAGALTPVDWKVTKGLAAQPHQVDEFRRAGERALEYATALGFSFLHPGPGQVPVDVERTRCLDTFCTNLEWICRQAPSGLTIIIEGVANARFPNIAIQTIADAAEIQDRVGSSKLKLVYDTYHLRMEEDGSLLDILDRYWPRIGYCQIGNTTGGDAANASKRQPPGHGEIDLDYIVRQLDQRGYADLIGLEFDSAGDTWSTLQWANAYGYNVPDRAHSRFASAV